MHPPGDRPVSLTILGCGDWGNFQDLRSSFCLLWRGNPVAQGNRSFTAVNPASVYVGVLVPQHFTFIIRRFFAAKTGTGASSGIIAASCPQGRSGKILGILVDPTFSFYANLSISSSRRSICLWVTFAGTLYTLLCDFLNIISFILVQVTVTTF